MDTNTCSNVVKQNRGKCFMFMFYKGDVVRWLFMHVVIVTLRAHCVHVHTRQYTNPMSQISLNRKGRLWCCTKSPTAQDMFWSIPGLISWAEVTGRWEEKALVHWNCDCWLDTTRKVLSRHQTPILGRGWSLGTRLTCGWKQGLAHVHVRYLWSQTRPFNFVFCSPKLQWMKFGVESQSVWCRYSVL